VQGRSYREVPSESGQTRNGSGRLNPNAGHSLVIIADAANACLVNSAQFVWFLRISLSQAGDVLGKGLARLGQALTISIGGYRNWSGLSFGGAAGHGEWGRILPTPLF